VTVDAVLHPPGSTVKVLYRNDWSDDRLRHDPPAELNVPVVHHPDGRATIHVDLPPAGMMILS
jgi:hypothetical protein